MGKESKHLRAFRERHLKGPETIQASAEGYIGQMMGQGDARQHNGALIITSERLAFYRKGFLGEVLETMELGKITSIERKSILGYRVIRFHTSHDQLEFKTFDKDAEAKVINSIEAWRSGREEPEGKEPAGQADPMHAIERLADLRGKGILSENEFQAKKASLLEKL